LNWDDNDIGNTNTMFMLGYAIGLFINGWIVDKINLKYFLLFCVYITSFNYYILYIFGIFKYKNSLVYCIMFLINGFI